MGFAVPLLLKFLGCAVAAADVRGATWLPAKTRPHYNRVMRIPWALPFLLASGCGGPDLTTHEGITDAMNEAREDLVEILEGITTKESAEAAKPALREIGKRERELHEAFQKLGEPEGEEERRLKAKVDAALVKLDYRAEAAVNRLRADAGTRAIVDPMMEEYLDAADPKGARSRREWRAIRDGAAMVEDMTRMRELAALARVAERFPLKDGAFDPYAFVETGGIKRDAYNTFRSARLGKGPTDEQIARGDYANFPWDRYRGDGSELKKSGTVPLLWEKDPGADGQHVVARIDGSCLVMSPADLKAALKR